MRVISTEMGFVLKFNNIDEMKQHVENLRGQIRRIETNKIKPPYLYAVYTLEATQYHIMDLLSKLKEGQ